MMKMINAITIITTITTTTITTTIITTTITLWSERLQNLWLKKRPSNG